MELKRGIRLGLRYYRALVREHFSNGKSLPQTINLLANDICNSKCQMCYIWKQKKDFEFSPTELGQILQDPLFAQVKHVGITGGEPTLRKDLSQLYQTCIDHLPQLRGMSIITNAIQYKQVTSRISEVKKVCDSAGLDFSAMVSLDGLGPIHDKIRGRTGNFETAVAVIDYLQLLLGEEKVSFGCTITKDNIWNMHTFLDFIEDKGYYGRFRIAEYINRLYNNSATKIIRTFNDDEVYELTTFFMRLIETYERNPTYQRTYSSIINMLNGGKRQINCPYQSQAVVLDSRGNMQYCAPKSKILGSALNTSATGLWNNNLDERDRIIREDCSDCIHDYHAPETVRDITNLTKKVFWERILSVDHYNKMSRTTLAILKLRFGYKSQKQLFITGWYGTETVGDKAILGSILQTVKVKYPNHTVVISTLTNEFVVQRTLDELQFSARIVDVYSEGFIKAALQSEITIMGGGPLMEMDVMAVPLWAFALAKANHRRTILWGCGIGPIKTKRFSRLTKLIIELSDQVKVRDTAALQWIMQESPQVKAQVSGDPAVDYIRSLPQKTTQPKPGFIACFLRDLPIEYSSQYQGEDTETLKQKFESQLAQYIIKKSEEKGLRVVLYPMHTLNIGGDDRIFARRFIQQHLRHIDASYISYPTAVEDITTAMQSSALNICMRFHSVVFASVLHTNFVAIDYTMGGKIKGFLRDKYQLDRYISVDDLLACSIAQI